MARDVNKKNTETGGERDIMDSSSNPTTSVETEVIFTYSHYQTLVKDLNELDKKIDRKITSFNRKIKEVEEIRESLKTEIGTLKIEAQSLKDEFSSLERRIEKTSNFTQWVSGALLITFFITGILIAFDYFNNNEQRYEKFIDRTEEIKKEFYTKSEVDASINTLKSCLSVSKWLNPKCLE